MRTKKLLVLTLVVFALAGATMTLAQYIEIVRDPPEPSECICPAIWDPVACRATDGSVRVFSNACFAGCSGYTKCVRYAVAE